MWARLFGAKIVLMETFARFEAPSLFGRLAAPLAAVKIVQSAKIQRDWPDALVIDPLELIGDATRAKAPVVFVTVGATLPFDRLVSMVADLEHRGQLPERVVIQTGEGGVRPVGIETHESLSFEQIQCELRRADIVICHAGTGSLITALREGCRVVAVPRQATLKEVYDDHQVEIARSFAVRGLIEVANNVDELAAALAKARRKPRVAATTNYGPLIDYLNSRLLGWQSGIRA
jgi:UDP-N-acetylglucosamine transferase subunit ALG13